MLPRKVLSRPRDRVEGCGSVVVDRVDLKTSTEDGQRDKDGVEGYR